MYTLVTQSSTMMDDTHERTEQIIHHSSIQYGWMDGWMIHELIQWSVSPVTVQYAMMMQCQCFEYQ
jgi:hypothetical protein